MAAQKNFADRVIGAASQGAVGAVVAAGLSSVTEPIVNRVLVKRVPLQEAIAEMNAEQILKFFQTVLPTNFIKFPFFEAINVIMSSVSIPPSLRGTVTGAVFCTATLPITNYRFRKSMNLPISAGDLYQAYLPTVLRDIIYGIVRNKVFSARLAANPEYSKTNAGRFMNMFVTVIASCIISAPGNELRGYMLQPANKRQSMKEFFQPEKFVRSTSIGAMIMGIALGFGALATPKVEAYVASIRAYLWKNPSSYLIIFLFMVHTYLENKRHQKQVAAIKDAQYKGGDGEMALQKEEQKRDKKA
eukprot:gnl/MRDRNA2_/MRDRNA2_87253_c0_seq1.p1 gnl/MRDRNA2_/MRDRNA2_87253_c0~~gnl/MRDRNA2_/MRDRNA2_87253_c0_seq1.p1  ORF type:complete len:330 (+),score=91.18 gnl/MRDRNA2_/MRDRNA2_87253_c0_seq1:86-991(+)